MCWQDYDLSMDNQIVNKYLEHPDFSPHLQACLEQVCASTGFIPETEIKRRCIYDPNKVWRVCVAGHYQGRPAVLRLENLKLEVDDEQIRQQFRLQCGHSGVRPPQTYFAQAYDPEKGFAFYIEELIQGRPIFDAAQDPDTAVKKFLPFYRLLRETVRHPFWEKPQTTELEFSGQQMGQWYDLAFKKYPERTTRLAPITDKLRGRLISHTPDTHLRFQHAHLTGNDVYLNEQGEYIVFANHFWSWRQNGYDITFPIWHMWLQLPVEKREAQAIKNITQTWMDAVYDSVRDLINPKDVELMLLNRLYGALLLDVPAKLNYEPAEQVDQLENALISEAERLLG